MIQKNQLKKILEFKKFIISKYKSYRLLPEIYRTLTGGLLLCLITLVFLLSYDHYRYSKTVSLYKTHSSLSISSRLSPKDALEILNQQTPLELVYNEQVQHYIQLYLNERKDQFDIFRQRSEIYFPIIESYLDKHELPLELKYLAVVESGLNPLAKSKSGAVGLWQFLYNTCTLLDLEVTS
ncbi:MAG: transglycosylase SLT domain-containing protein, partial [Bacteroidales bacterium]|nr:transglycosylase SLT domain-containing protein [Bacteroidales bacterium]